MQNNINLKTLKLAVLLTIAGFALASAAGQTGRQFEIAGFEASLDERAGKDDGAAFAIHFTGDTHGGLEPCG